jgi:hypothetical protein
MPELFRFALASRPLPAPPETRNPAEYIWYGCDLVSGAIVEELPFVASGPLQRIIGAYSSVQGSIAIPDSPPNWERATDPMRTMLVCVRADDAVVMWAGMVLARSGGSGETVDLSLATLEAYYDRRYITDQTWNNYPSSFVAAFVMNSVNPEGIGLVYPTSVGPTGDTISRAYTSVSDTTVYSVLGELMASNPFEWTITVDWKDSTHTAFKKYFEGGPTVHGSPPGGVPSAVFDMPGCVTEYTFTEDYTSSKGANHITMFGDGEGDARPSSGAQVRSDLISAGWPRVEYRATRSGVTQTNTLIRHAQDMLAWKAQGAQIFTVTADATTGPRLGVDWALGDVVAVDVYHSPRHPDGFHITARSIGWELDVTSPIPTVTPLLQEETDAE